MCPSADCGVCSSVLPECVRTDCSSWARLWPGEGSTLQMDLSFSRREPSRLCLWGPAGAGSLLWVMSPAWPLAHLLVQPQDVSPPRAPVSGSLRSAGEGTCRWLWAAGSQPRDAEHRRAQHTRCPVFAGQARHGHCPLLRPPFLGVAGPSEPVFTVRRSDEANFVGFMKIKVRVCM